MAITAISVLRRDPALANASGLLAGSTGPAGSTGLDGEKGDPGPNGRGVSNLAVDGSGNLITTYSDGTTSNAGQVTVPPADASSSIVTVPASEALGAGDMVNLWVNGNTVNARKADASQADGAKFCNGFTLTAITAGSVATVYLNGLNKAKSGLTPNVDYYLDPGTPGGITTSAPTLAGQTLQKVGRAISATSINIQPQPFIGLH